MTTATNNTVFITEEHLGPFATEADARKMIELLNARGYDAHYGADRNRRSDDENIDYQFEADWNACLEQWEMEGRE